MRLYYLAVRAEEQRLVRGGRELSLHTMSPQAPRCAQLGNLAYVSIRQHTSAYVSIRQHTSADVSIRELGLHRMATGAARAQLGILRQHASACFSMHMSAYAAVR